MKSKKSYASKFLPVLKVLLFSVSFLFCISSQSKSQVKVSTLTASFNGSGGVAVDSAGNIYVADYGQTLPNANGTTVTKVLRDGSFSVFATGLSGASGNSFDSQGNLFQSNIAANKISKITPAGVVSDFTSTNITGPVGIAIDTADNVYVANCGGASIAKITPDGLSSTIIASGAPLSCPNGLTIDDAGNLYTCNFNNGNVIRITQGGAMTILTTLPGGNNGHLTFANGVLYVVDRGGNRIWEVTLTGQRRVLAGSGACGKADGSAGEASFSFPNGIRASHDGDTLYVNDAVPLCNANLDPVVVRMITGVRSKEFSATLNGDQLVPPVVTAAFGSGQFFLNADSTELTYEIGFQGLSGPVTAAHFHNAGIDTNGSVVKTITGSVSGDSIIGVWTSMDGEPLTPAMVTQLFLGRLYINIHTAANPGGEIRGQVLMESIGPEPQLSLTHTTGNFTMGIFNDGSIGAENAGFSGPGVFWNGLPGLFVGGPIFGTSGVGAVNGLIGSFLVFGDLINQGSDFGSGFSSTPDFDQVSLANLDDTGAPAPYGVEVLQSSYSNTGDDFAILRYGYVNASGAALSGFYAGIFIDWDIAPGAVDIGGYAIDRNLVYNFNPGGAGNPGYYGIVALNGLSGMITTTGGTTGGARSEAFANISTIDTNPIVVTGDYRTWVGGMGPVPIAAGDTAWATFAITAGNDLADIREHAALASQKAATVWNDIVVTDIADAGGTVVAGKFALNQNYPNPFNPSTRIEFQLADAGKVSLTVYNVLGQKVRTLVSGELTAGLQSVVWDGKNDAGQAVSAGVYVYELVSGKLRQNRKMLFLK